MPHRHRHVVARFHAADADVAERAIRAALDARREWSAMRWEARAAVLLRAAELLAGPWRARINAATMHGQSKTAPPGRDRRGVRADRLLAVQRRRSRSSSTACSRAARPGMWNMTRAAAARGLRVRADAVQLHRDRRQPADRARADGQHRRVEAGRGAAARRRGDIVRAARGGRAAARRHQLHPRARRTTRRTSSSITPSFAGIHFTGSTDVFRTMWKRVADNLERYKTLPAARRRDRRQGLHPRAPVGGSARARDRDRARRLRVPGPEVLGRVARLRRASRVGGDEGRAGRDDRRHQASATSATSRTSWAR